MLRVVLFAVLLIAPSVGLADALPDCPPGTHMVMNPTPPGAMHHGGGSCVPDAPSPPPPPAPPPPAPPPPAPPPAATPEASGGCRASPVSRAPLAAGALVSLTMLALRRRRAV